jgi:hypothetical protein
VSQAVKGNLEKLPGDFMFRLAEEEIESLSRSNKFRVG